VLVSQYHKTRISAVVSLRRKFLKKTPWKVLSVIVKSLWNIRFALKSHGFSLETFPVESTGSLALVREIGGQRLQFRGQLSDLPGD
jgi:hypothetical protein